MIDPETQKQLITLYVPKKALYIKASLRVQKRSQFTYHQIKNAVKNEIYLKKLH